jgi:hypothetical protein
VERDPGPLHDRTHGHSESFPAPLLTTAINTRTLGLVAMIDDAAVWANRTFRPQDAFQHRPGSFVILEVRFGEKADLGHGNHPLVKQYELSRLVVSTR